MRENRTFQQMREISFETNVNLHAEGSCLVKYGNTKVICTASVDEKTPHWLRNSGKGWVTAEYGMLPRSTNTRIDREAAKGKQSGRTQEIQRLIGRSLRSVIILENLGEKQIKIMLSQIAQLQNDIDSLQKIRKELELNITNLSRNLAINEFFPIIRIFII